MTLFESLQETKEKVEQLGYTVLFVANYGSQNYNLDENSSTYQSDIDTKAIIIPQLKDLVNNSKPVSTTIEISEGLCDIKDIRSYVETLMKSNIQYFETLCSKQILVNEHYIDDVAWMREHLDDLVYENRRKLVKSIYGMTMEKKKALCHPYPTIKDKIDKYGYDGKQLHHIVRLNIFLKRYFINGLKFKDSILFTNGAQRDNLMKIKKNKLSLVDAIAMADRLTEENRILKEQLLDKFDKEPVYTSFCKLYQDKSKQIIYNNIIREVKGGIKCK